MARFSPVILTISAVFAVSSQAAFAAPADMEVLAPQMADAFVQLMAPDASAETRQQYADEMAVLGASFAKVEMFEERAPKAFVQAATLARDGSIPATRGVMYDLARTILVNGALLAERPQDDFAVLRLWNEADPMRAEIYPGLGLAQSDIDALDRLRELDVSGGFNAMPAADSSAQLMLSTWEGMDDDANKVFPTKLNAYVDGVAANWDQMSDAEQERAVSIFTATEVLSPKLTKKALGADNYAFWLGTVLVPMSDAEKEANPDIVYLSDNGVFAGPLEKPLTELIVAMRAKQSSGGGGDLSGAALQLFRLNNWSASEGEMHSWEAYRYSTQGY